MASGNGIRRTGLSFCLFQITLGDSIHKLSPYITHEVFAISLKSSLIRKERESCLTPCWNTELITIKYVHMLLLKHHIKIAYKISLIYEALPYSLPIHL